MINPETFFKALTDQNVGYYTGVPDSLLTSFCAYITDHVDKQHHLIAANEGAAIGLALGDYLATGRVPLVYMQNSGLGNAINPLASLVDPQVYGIPMLLLIGWRGEPHIKDEPQHIKQGAITLELLNTLGIAYTVLDGQTPNIAQCIHAAVRAARTGRCAHALVVRKGSFSQYRLQKQPTAQTYGWTRERAIQMIVDTLNEQDITVSTTGMASRELFEYRAARGDGHQRDFLTVGGMGHASQIARALAARKGDRRIICIDGDGAALMHMGAFATNGQSHLTNLFHIVINNAAHDSVGGQPTVGSDIEFNGIAHTCGYRYSARCDDPKQGLTAIKAFVQQTGPALLELRVDKGYRSDLGRPTLSPEKNCSDFIRFVKESHD